MKVLFIYLISLFCASVAIAQNQAPVELNNDLLEKLNINIKKRIDSAIRQMPIDVKEDILSAGNAKIIYDIPERSQKWLINCITSMTQNDELMQSFEEVHKSIKNKGDFIFGEDNNAMLKLALFDAVYGKPFNLQKELEFHVLYWRENKTPSVKFSPNGLGEIEWMWTLPIELRIGGALHVGIDVKKRTFICYEYTKGVYFPEGDVLDRIYKEIVLQPDFARVFFGNPADKK